MGRCATWRSATAPPTASARPRRRVARPYGLAQALTAHYSPITFANVAISGATSADILRVQIPQVAEFGPDLVTLFVGPNDVTHLRSRRAYLADMARLLTALDGVPAAIVTNVCAVRLCPVLTPVFRLLVDLQCRRFNAALPAEVARHHARLATLNPDLVPPFAAAPQDLYAADGYHPNDAGYRLWADYLAPRVLAALADTALSPPSPNLTLAADGGVYAIRNSAVRCPLHPSPLPLNPQDRCARSRDRRWPGHSFGSRRKRVYPL